MSHVSHPTVIFCNQRETLPKTMTPQSRRKSRCFREEKVWDRPLPRLGPIDNYAETGVRLQKGARDASR